MIKTQEMVEEKRGRELPVERKNVTVSFGTVNLSTPMTKSRKKIEKKLYSFEHFNTGYTELQLYSYSYS